MTSQIHQIQRMLMNNPGLIVAEKGLIVAEKRLIVGIIKHTSLM